MIASIVTSALIGLSLLCLLVISMIPLGVHLGFRAPRVRATSTPADLGIPFESVRISTVRGRCLAGWLMPTSDNAPSIIMVHGWGSNAELMLPLAQPLYRQGFNVLLFDARNHGASDADTFSSLPRFAEDLSAAIRWMREQHPSRTEKIAVLGHSVGAGAALFEATRNPQIDAVISIGAFADPARLTARYLSRLHLPGFVVALTKRYVEWVIGYRFATIAPVNSIRRVRCPVLLVHGTHDTTVPIEDGRQIAAAADPSRVQFLPISGAGHDSVDKIEAHARQIVDFLGCVQDANA